MMLCPDAGKLLEMSRHQYDCNSTVSAQGLALAVPRYFSLPNSLLEMPDHVSLHRVYHSVRVASRLVAGEKV